MCLDTVAANIVNTLGHQMEKYNCFSDLFFCVKHMLFHKANKKYSKYTHTLEMNECE